MHAHARNVCLYPEHWRYNEIANSSFLAASAKRIVPANKCKGVHVQRQKAVLLIIAVVLSRFPRYNRGSPRIFATQRLMSSILEDGMLIT